MTPDAHAKAAADLLQAEATGTTQARLEAYEQLRQMVDWLRVPFDDPEQY